MPGLTNTLNKHLGKAASAPLVACIALTAFDSSYPTGGEPFDAGAVARTLGGYDKEPTVAAVLIEPKAGYVFTYDRAAKKILAYQVGADGAMVQVPNATDLALITGVMVVILHD